MARTVKDAKIGSRAARDKLAPRGKVYWRTEAPGLHLGYRKLRRKNGSWWVRHYLGEQRYEIESIGVADDLVDADGVLVLSFDQAQTKARASAVKRAHKAAGLGALPTVREAVEEYVAGRDKREAARRGRPSRSDASQRLARYVLGAQLAGVTLDKLDEETLTKWRAGLPDKLRATSVQRTTSDFKAALNAAYDKHHKRLGADFAATVKRGLRTPRDEHDDDAEPVARANQILSDAQVGAIIVAAREVDADEGWEGDFFRLVIVLAATGARFSQVARMRVGDVRRDLGKVMVPPSRKGRGRKTEAISVQVGEDVLIALLPAVTGRPDGDFLLERWTHTQVPGKGLLRWVRNKRGPWLSSAGLAREWADVRKRATMPNLIPYALRHSSIVRGLRAGLPISLVAKVHDTSASMIENHYGKWIADGLDTLAAKAVVPLVPVEKNKVTALRARQ